ncbi:MAG: hypothetical protein HY243_10570 [Proteobacteria bacterium]|nr:hypothetical protein [Pseudomonadota bacterium]
MWLQLLIWVVTFALVIVLMVHLVRLFLRTIRQPPIKKDAKWILKAIYWFTMVFMVAGIVGGSGALGLWVLLLVFLLR